MPTFGVESAGGSTLECEGWSVGVRPYSPASDGTATTLSAYVLDGQANSHTAVMALYNDTTSALIAGSSDSHQDMGTSAAWYDWTVSCSVVTTVSYLIMFWSNEASSGILVYYDTVENGGKGGGDGTWPTWPNPITIGGNNDKFSFHVDYTAAGGSSTYPSDRGMFRGMFRGMHRGTRFIKS